MGKHQPTPPTPPDPTVVANAQAAANKTSANFQSTLNNTNVQGPYGSVNYTQNPSTSQWTQNTTLSPQEQALYNSGSQAQIGALGVANNQLGNVQSALYQHLSPTGPLASHVGGGSIQSQIGPFGQIQGQLGQGGPIQAQIGPQDFNQSVHAASDAAYRQATSRLDPQWAQNSESQQAQLTAQGLNPNDAAYQNSQRLFDNAKNDAYNQAAYSGVAAGNQEQNLLFGQQAAQGQFANSAQAQGFDQGAAQGQFANTAQAQGFGQQASQGQFANSAQAQGFDQGAADANLFNAANQQQFANTAYAQQLPINEFNSLMSNSQVQAPQSQAAQTAVGNTDVLGAYGLQAQQANANYQAQMQNYQSGLGGLAGLGKAALGLVKPFALSDRRLKHDIKPLGARLGGFALYTFRYLWSEALEVGVMAQEVMASRPGAVRVTPDGWLAVNYAALT